MKKTVVVHPYLFALFPVISLYAHNIDQVPVRSVLWAVAGSLFVSGLLVLLSRYVLRDFAKGAVFATFVLIVFFSWGHIHSLIFGWIATITYNANFKVLHDAAKYDILIHAFLLIAFLLIGEILMVRVLRRRRVGREGTRILNIVSVVLVTFSVVRLVSYNVQVDMLHYPGDKGVKAYSVAPVVTNRDIYYLILDGYARADILEEFYGFDNREFLNYLKKKGFYVVPKAHSNYAWTFLSLASSLNFDYINYLANTFGESSTDLRVPYEMTKNNRVANFLKSKGYLFVHFNSTCGATLTNKYADRQVSYEKGVFQDEFLRILVRSTMLRLMDPLIVRTLAEVYLNTFRVLETIPEMEEATFAFVHILLPHDPYIFDRDGNVKTNRIMWNQFRAGAWRDKDAYIDQLIFVNKQVRTAVDRIMEKSEVAPIIIIQSDHGPKLPELSRADFIRARMANLQACYLPDGGNQFLYDSITPVNTFRIVLNFYFDTNHKLLKDVLYFSDSARPFTFLDVTDQIQDW
jgi:hypothetical protein